MRNTILTIGLPVFNGAPHLQEAIDSLLGQTYTDFILVISDNASTDDTPLICEASAARDSRIVYIRQPRNLGAMTNFQFVLKRARTPLFMWAAHDDRWDPTFVAKNVAQLDSDPAAIASISRVEFVRDGMVDSRAQGTVPLCGNVRDNLRRFWWPPNEIARFYAIFRTEALQSSFPELPTCSSFDAVVVALTLRFGHYLEVPEALMWRTAPDPGRYETQYKSQNPSLIWRLFPALRASFWAVKYGGRHYSFAALISLLCYNLAKHQDYLRFWHPKLYRAERMLYYFSGVGVLRAMVKASQARLVREPEA